MSSPTDDFLLRDPLIDEPSTITSGNNNTIIGIANDGRTYSPTAPPMPEEHTPDELPWVDRPEEPGQWYSSHDEGNSSDYGWTVSEQGPTESETYSSGINVGNVFVFVVFICVVALAAFQLCARLIYQTRNRTMNRSTNRKYGANAAAAAATTEEHLKTFHHLPVPHGSAPGSESTTAATYPTSYAATFAASSGAPVAGSSLGGGAGGDFGGGCDAGGGGACGM